MKDIKQAIKEAHDFADKAIKGSGSDFESWNRNFGIWLNSGLYSLNNKHVLGWIGVTVVACMLF